MPAEAIAGASFNPSPTTATVLPDDFEMPDDGVNIRNPDKSVEQDRRMAQYRMVEDERGKSRLEPLDLLASPFENGPGCDALNDSVIVTTSEPCDTAAGVTRTLSPITTVPVRELTMTLAATAPGSISRFSSMATNAVR